MKISFKCRIEYSDVLRCDLTNWGYCHDLGIFEEVISDSWVIKLHRWLLHIPIIFIKKCSLDSPLCMDLISLIIIFFMITLFLKFLISIRLSFKPLNSRCSNPSIIFLHQLINFWGLKFLGDNIRELWVCYHDSTV